MRPLQAPFVFLALLGAFANAALTTLEAEDGSLLDVFIKTKHIGFTGSGYGDYNDGGGGSIEWEYEASSKEKVDIFVRYASASQRSLDLYVDGKKEGTFSCPSTGDWDNWAEDKITIELKKGKRKLLLDAPGLGPNVDSLSILSTDTNTPKPTPQPTPQPTARPTSNPTGRPTSSASPGVPKIYEAEAALSNFVTFETFHSGFDGTSYADFQRSSAYLLWDVEAPTTSSYQVTAKYASFNERNCNVYIDGILKGTFLFKGNGDWGTWQYETIIIQLSRGDYNLKVAADFSTGPNIDWISIASCGDSCAGGLSFTANPTPAPTPRPTDRPTLRPTPQPISTPPPTMRPTDRPTNRPTPQPPTGRPTDLSFGSGYWPSSYSYNVVTRSNGRLDKGDFVSSPNGQFRAGLTNDGDLVLQYSNGRTIWSSETAGRGERLFVQSDGNVIVRQGNNRAIWTSRTYDHPGSQLVVDDGGQIAVMQGSLPIWLQGIPRSSYTGRPSTNLQFPLRGYFYYPWFPETWTVNGAPVKYLPESGLYSSSDPDVVRKHIDELEYGYADLTIASWWGPETNQDRGRLTLMMEELLTQGSSIKLSVYHEQERDKRPSPAELRSDLDYLKKWYAWHPSWGHIDDRPVIFAFNEIGCDVPRRWMEASNGEWYVVLKLFPGYMDCPVQPDHWHQYAVDDEPLEYRGVSFTIAPGFWRADKPSPLLPRLSAGKFCENVKNMVQSQEPLQLIVSYNEHGEATGVESSRFWDSPSGYGYYLDCLHQYF